MTKSSVGPVAASSARNGRTKVTVKKAGNCEKAPAACAGEKVACRLRTWDQRAARCIQLKLGHFPSSQLANNKDSSGALLHPKVLDELMRLQSQKNM